MTLYGFKRTRLACYSAYYTMSSVFSLPPLLFVTFREAYGLSWTLLGTLVLINFFTQLITDLFFTFFSKYLNLKVIIKIMPLITSLGLTVYALIPMLFSDIAYVGLVIGTVIFSVSAGFSEVLLSPMIAAMPSDNPKRDMSFLHSLYAFGVFSVVLIGSLYLKLVGEEYWHYLTLFFAALPIISSVLFFISPFPDMSKDSSKKRGKRGGNQALGIALCAACIFLGSCAENVMANWISGYMEVEIGLDKAVGDLVGMALFAILLGAGRICYAKWGKSIFKTLLFGMTGAAICYFLAALSPYSIPAVAACVLAGIFTSMLWPGTLILLEEKIPGAGVGAFALMAASGDFGASVAPQLMGIVADGSGLRTGMLVSSTFPVLGIIVVVILFLHLGGAKKHKL